MSYKKQNQNQFLHPFTFFIVSSIQDIYATMKENRITNATKKLFYFLYFLDPEIKNVLAEGATFKKMSSMMENMSQVKREDFLDMLDKIMISLHVAGYFAAAKFGPTTKTTTMRDMEMKIREAVYDKKKEAENARG